MSVVCIGIIGDVHEEDQRLAAALAMLSKAACSLIACTGDLVDGNGDVDRCCSLLQQNHVVTVQGNHDEWFLRNDMRSLPGATARSSVKASTLDFLSSLPKTTVLPIGNSKALLCHGLGEDNMGRLIPEDYGYALESNDNLQRIIRAREFEYVVCGHTHHPMVRDIDGISFINPGSLNEGTGLITIMKDPVTVIQYVFDEERGTFREA